MKKIYGLLMLILILFTASCGKESKFKETYSAFDSSGKVEKEAFLVPEEEFFRAYNTIENRAETDCLSYWCRFIADEDQTYYVAYWSVVDSDSDFKTIIDKVKQMKNSSVEVFYLDEKEGILNAALKVSDCPYYRYKLALNSDNNFKKLEVGNYFQVELKAKTAVYFKVSASVLDLKIVTAIYAEKEFLSSLTWNNIA